MMSDKKLEKEIESTVNDWYFQGIQNPVKELKNEKIKDIRPIIIEGLEEDNVYITPEDYKILDKIIYESFKDFIKLNDLEELLPGKIKQLDEEYKKLNPKKELKEFIKQKKEEDKRNLKLFEQKQKEIKEILNQYETEDLLYLVKTYTNTEEKKIFNEIKAKKDKKYLIVFIVDFMELSEDNLDEFIEYISNQEQKRSKWEREHKEGSALLKQIIKKRIIKPKYIEENNKFFFWKDLIQEYSSKKGLCEFLKDNLPKDLPTELKKCSKISQEKHILYAIKDEFYDSINDFKISDDLKNEQFNEVKERLEIDIKSYIENDIKHVINFNENSDKNAEYAYVMQDEKGYEKIAENKYEVLEYNIELLLKNIISHYVSWFDNLTEQKVDYNEYKIIENKVKENLYKFLFTFDYSCEFLKDNLLPEKLRKELIECVEDGIDKEIKERKKTETKYLPEFNIFTINRVIFQEIQNVHLNLDLKEIRTELEKHEKEFEQIINQSEFDLNLVDGLMMEIIKLLDSLISRNWPIESSVIYGIKIRLGDNIRNALQNIINIILEKRESVKDICKFTTSKSVNKYIQRETIECIERTLAMNINKLSLPMKIKIVQEIETVIPKISVDVFERYKKKLKFKPLYFQIYNTILSKTKSNILTIVEKLIDALNEMYFELMEYNGDIRYINEIILISTFKDLKSFLYETLLINKAVNFVPPITDYLKELEEYVEWSNFKQYKISWEDVGDISIEKYIEYLIYKLYPLKVPPIEYLHMRFPPYIKDKYPGYSNKQIDSYISQIGPIILNIKKLESENVKLKKEIEEKKS
jgi:hypothetical protein